MIATKFLRLYLCFLCRATRLHWSKHCRVSGWVRNQRWRPVTGSGYGITLIQTTMSMLLRSSNMIELVRILSYVRMSGISKMATCNRKWMHRPTTKLQQTLTWKNIRISPVIEWQSWCLMEWKKFQRIYLCFWHQVDAKYIRWNFFVIVYTSCDIRYSITTSGYSTVDISLLLELNLGMFTSQNSASRIFTCFPKPFSTSQPLLPPPTSSYLPHHSTPR